MKLYNALRGPMNKIQEPTSASGSGPLLGSIIAVLHSSNPPAPFPLAEPLFTATLLIATCQKSTRGSRWRRHAAGYRKRREGEQETGDTDEWQQDKEQTDGRSGGGSREPARAQSDGGRHSPLPEIVRSCVRKLSWTCDSDRVV